MVLTIRAGRSTAVVVTPAPGIAIRRPVHHVLVSNDELGETTPFVCLHVSNDACDADPMLGPKNLDTDAAHGSWTETYNNPELYEWLLKHKRRTEKAVE
jgi:hypothetical protein